MKHENTLAMNVHHNNQKILEDHFLID